MEAELARAASTAGKLEYVDNKFAMFTPRSGTTCYGYAYYGCTYYGAAMAFDGRECSPVTSPVPPSEHPLRRGDGHRRREAALALRRKARHRARHALTLSRTLSLTLILTLTLSLTLTLTLTLTVSLTLALALTELPA